MEDVKRQTEIKIEQHQREFYLRQQLRAIQAELGEADPGEKEAVELLRRRSTKRSCPEKVGAGGAARDRAAAHAVAGVERVPGASARTSTGSSRCRGTSESGDDGDRAQEGRGGARRRGTTGSTRRRSASSSTSPCASCAAATRTARSSASSARRAPARRRSARRSPSAIGREFYRISVGGVRDEAEIRGHRRTYVGAMPGLLIQALRRVQVSDPGAHDRRDRQDVGRRPVAATRRRRCSRCSTRRRTTTFVDHYLNLPFDLSSVLFICTANNLFDIPAPLRDRMEVIRIAGYTVEEKVEIAWRYLLPRLLEEHGITDKDIQFTDESLSFISSRYSREAGLRNFERNLAAIMRKRARAQGGGRGRRVGHRHREGRGGARHPALRRGGSGEGAGGRRRSPVSRGRRPAATS